MKRRLFVGPGAGGRAMKIIKDAAGRMMPAGERFVAKHGEKGFVNWVLKHNIGVTEAEAKSMFQTAFGLAKSAGGSLLSGALKRAAGRSTIGRVSSMNAAGSLTQSYTSFGKIPKLKLTSSPNYRFGISKDMLSGNIDLGSLAADFGKQKSVDIIRYPKAANLISQAEALKDGTWKSWKIQPISVTIKLMFNNMDIANSIVDIYECVSRKDDGDTSPVTSWYDGAQDISVSFDTTDLDSTPYAVPQFNKRWRVIKRTRVPLSPGCTHYHTARYGGFRPQLVTDIESATKVNMRGSTFAIFFVVKGTPVKDSSDRVSTSTPIITWALTRIMKLRVLDATAPTYWETSSFGTIDPAAAQIRETDGDVVTGNQNAGTEN